MCGCSKGSGAGATVYRVIYPDGTRSPDFARQADAEADNRRRGNTGTIVPARSS